MKRIIIPLLLTIIIAIPAFSKNYKVSSPDKNILINIEINEDIHFRVYYKNKLVIENVNVGITFNESFELGFDPRVRGKKKSEIEDIIHAVIPTKYKEYRNKYNELDLTFRQPFHLIFRVYNDGFAYRITGETNQTVEISDELAEYTFPEKTRVWFPEEVSFISHYERMYQDTLLSGIEEKDFCSLPVLLKTQDGTFISICDSDVKDYPQMFLEKNEENMLKAVFPYVILETKETRRPHNEEIIQEASYIAETKGFREFPWRAFIITDQDEELVASNLIYTLAEESRIKSSGWIKPGLVAWDWWNANNITGVDFRAGVNTNTYKYYIDFASKYGLDYIILDEGWSNSGDVFDINPDIDLQEIISYGKKKNVGIILWVLWKPLDKVMDQFMDSCQAWGVKGLKIDFMQRADQAMVNYYWKTAEKASQHQMILDFHGAYKPAGFNRTWPNVLSHEGLKGLENCKWSELITPEHDVTLPFIRMVGGPMDYTPGAMVNKQKKNFNISWNQPMSMGTRCHEIAKYVVFESPLQMLADSPSNYLKEDETTEFISKIPTTWDDTKVLDAKVGEYIVIARRKGDKWYIGAMTNWEPREFKISLDFLEEGTYDMIIMKDGLNADRNAMDYRRDEDKVTNSSEVKVKLAPGGGFAAIIKK